MDRKISVFLPILINNHHDRIMTDTCIKLLRRMTDIPFELCVVETEGEYVQKHGQCRYYLLANDKFDKYHHFDKPPGMIATTLKGIEICSHDMIVEACNDVYVTQNWLECLIEPFDRYDDCGASTLAEVSLGQQKQDLIQEGIQTTLMLIKREFIKFDTNYKETFSDTDMIMQMYLKGYKMYRNFNSIMWHIQNETIARDEQYYMDYQKNHEYFMDKYRKHRNLWIYHVLAGGIII